MSIDFSKLKPDLDVVRTIQKFWLCPEDTGIVREKGENHETYTGNKYGWYAGYTEKLEPKSILEIGVRYGYSMAAMLYGLRYKGKGAKVTLIDIDPLVVRTSYKLQGVFTGSTVVHLVENSLHWRAVNYADVMGPHGYDIIHIDGWHTYEHCLADLQNYGQFITEGGLIIVDDVKNPPVMQAAKEYAEHFDLPTHYVEHNTGHLLMEGKAGMKGTGFSNAK